MLWFSRLVGQAVGDLRYMPQIGTAKSFAASLAA